MAVLVDDPVWGPGTFTSPAEAHQLSASAVLLLLREQVLQARETFRGELDAATDELANRTLESDLEGALIPWAHGRVPESQARQELRRPSDFVPADDLDEWSGAFGNEVERFFERPDSATLVSLVAACQLHPAPLVRIASAAAARSIAGRSERYRMSLATAALGTDDELTRDLACTLLELDYPDDPALQTLTLGPPGPSIEPAHTTVLVHGTFARNGVWWRPGAPFHTYIRDSVRPDLYGGTDPFSWPGAYSRDARAIGALDLLAWTRRHQADGLDTITHSHGGSVAMLATRGGLRVGTLGMLSCPVHWNRVQPDFSRVGHALNVRVRLDLVLLADGGLGAFPDRRIVDVPLPLWFDHGATHDEAVWARYNLARYF